jgi:hypothetical protein
MVYRLILAIEIIIIQLVAIWVTDTMIQTCFKTEMFGPNIIQEDIVAIVKLCFNLCLLATIITCVHVHLCIKFV